MKKSWRMARVAGIDIDIHWSFSIIIIWALVQSFFEERAFTNTLLFVTGILLVFGCIMLHEIGHALMALGLKVEVKNIILLPFGGMARIQTVPDRPGYEFLIALSGPLVNLAIAVAFIPLLFALGGSVLVENMVLMPNLLIPRIIRAFFEQNSLTGLVVLLIVTNLLLFAFNLIPAFPMDGGRILRSTLTLFMPYARATRVALVLGYITAVVLVIVAIQYRNAALLFVAAFVFLTARPRRRSVLR